MIKSAEIQRPYPLGHGGRRKEDLRVKPTSFLFFQKSVIQCQSRWLVFFCVNVPVKVYRNISNNPFALPIQSFLEAGTQQYKNRNLQFYGHHSFFIFSEVEPQRIWVITCYSDDMEHLIIYTKIIASCLLKMDEYFLLFFIVSR